MGAAPFLLGLLGMSTPPRMLPPGVWGGEQVILEVGPDKAILRLGCAQGEFTGPIALDERGRFARTGTYMAFGGGPSTSSDRPLPADYAGAIEGDRLTLTIAHGGTSERYQLTRGMQSKVIRCL